MCVFLYACVHVPHIKMVCMVIGKLNAYCRVCMCGNKSKWIYMLGCIFMCAHICRLIYLHIYYYLYTGMRYYFIHNLFLLNRLLRIALYSYEVISLYISVITNYLKHYILIILLIIRRN